MLAFVRTAALAATLLPAAALAPGALAAAPVTGPGAGCLPRVSGGWLRSPPMPMPMMAGFGSIDNACTAELAVTGARSAAFDRVELHETRTVEGVSRMRPVSSLPLPAGGTAVLRPGGLHLMLMQPVSPLRAGDAVRVEFTLADGRVFGADFEVRAADAR